MNSSRHPERLAKAWPQPYVYPAAWKRGVAAVCDFLFGLVFLPSPLQVPWYQIKRVAVLRLDHLGDVLNSFGALEELRRALPNARIDLFVGPWGEQAAKMSGSVTDVFVVEAPWFARPKRSAWPWASIKALGKRLAIGEYELVVELRGDLRHHIAARLSAAPWRVGLAQTMGGFLLTHRTGFKPGLHESEQNLTALRAAGLPMKAAEKKNSLRISSEAKAESDQVLKTLKLKKGFVAVQASCGTAAKRWMPQRWAELIRRLDGRQVVLLGSAQEHAEMDAIVKKCKKKPANAAGLLGLQALVPFLKNASVLISLDTGPGHLAAMAGVPMVSLLSGTQRKEQWGPLGQRVIALQKTPECSPCELSECPFNNECMRRIEVDEVLDAIEKLGAWQRP